MKHFLFLFALILMMCAQNLAAQSVYGEMNLEYAEGYLLATTTMPDGADACFAIDLAAPGTVVTTAFAGNRNLQKLQGSNDPLNSDNANIVLGGFGFTPEIVGKTTLQLLNVGGISFPDADVMVMNQTPSVAGRTLAGVIGVDMLRRAEVVVFRYGSKPALVLQSKGNTTVKGAIELPMKVTNNAVFIEGTLNGRKVDFLLDTGSPASYLPVKTLRLTGAAALPNSTREITTLEGTAAKVRSAQVESITLGEETFTGLPFFIGELPVFGQLPESVTPVLLGNSCLATMQFVELNFQNNTVRMKKS